MDILHQVVTEARARRQRGETGDGSTRVDGWRAGLQPRAAVRARTIPALERERDSLRARLAEVHFSFIYPPPRCLGPRPNGARRTNIRPLPPVGPSVLSTSSNPSSLRPTSDPLLDRARKSSVSLIFIQMQMEKENMELYQEVRENVEAQDQADAKTAEIFGFFDEV